MQVNIQVPDLSPSCSYFLFFPSVANWGIDSLLNFVISWHQASLSIREASTLLVNCFLPNPMDLWWGQKAVIFARSLALLISQANSSLGLAGYELPSPFPTSHLLPYLKYQN